MANDTSPADCMRLLTLNCMLVPTSGDIRARAAQAAAWLLAHARECDVLVLTEVMDAFGSSILETALAKVWRYQTRPLQPTDIPNVVNGGVLLASKWPLDNAFRLVFQQSSSSDALASKGVVAATVRCPLWRTPFVVLGTHLQSMARKEAVRQNQLQELEWLLHSYLPTHAGPLPRVVAGDWNFEQRGSTLLADIGVHAILPPASDGPSYDLEHNVLAAKRKEHDDTTALLDAVGIDQRHTPFVFYAMSHVVRPRNADGSPFTDHEAVLAVVAAVRAEDSGHPHPTE